MATDTDASTSGLVDNWQGEKTLAECTLHMLTTQDDCDVHFLVGPKEEKVSAHRFILIIRSCVFQAMLCGPLAEKEKILLPDVEKKPFIQFLKFLYTDICSLSAANATAVLYLSKKYAVERLRQRCLTFLEEHLTPQNAFVMLDQAHLFDEQNLLGKTLDVINQNFNVCLQSPDFRELSSRCLDMVLSSFDVHLEAVFKAALEWASAECERTGKDPNPPNKRLVLGKSLYTIGFTGFDASTLVKIVIPAQVLHENEVIKLMSYLTCPDFDVTPFRVIRKVAEIHELDLYKRSRSPVQTEIEFVQTKNVSDRFSVEPDFDMCLTGVLLAPMDGTFEVTIEYKSKAFETVRCISKVKSSKLDCEINIQAGTECIISVVPQGEECPSEIMSDLKTGYAIGSSNISFERKAMPLYRTKGMVMKLLVKKNVDRVH